MRVFDETLYTIFNCILIEFISELLDAEKCELKDMKNKYNAVQKQLICFNKRES